MKKENLVINTLMFLNDYNKGMKQLEMIDILNDIGFRKIEVRREFMMDIAGDTKLIGAKAKIWKLEILYSVPQYLYINKTMQIEDVEMYFKEAKTMDCHYVKLVIGDYGEIKESDIKLLNSLCDTYEIILTIENDQTTENGKGQKIIEFLEKYSSKGGEIGMTFDMGNWIWQGEDPLHNAELLSPYIKYIHVKDVANREEPKTVCLGEGIIPWQEILQVLPSDVPIALEYPLGDNAKTLLIREASIICD